jgi:hypothetical protein
LVLDHCHPLALSDQHLTLVRQRLFSGTLRQKDGLLPYRNERLRHLTRQRRQARLTIQAPGQLFPPLIEQGADPRRTATAQLQAHALYRRPYATRHHRVRGGKYLIFRHPTGGCAEIKEI